MVDTPIGTNSPNYELQPTDVGATIFCRVTATNASGSAQAFSNVVGPVAAAPPSSFTPADLPGIALWLDAHTGMYKTGGTDPVTTTGDLVYYWHDQSGLGHNIGREGGLTKPTYNSAGFNTSYPAVMFSAAGATGIDNYPEIAFFSATSVMSVFIVVRPTLPTADYEQLISYLGTSSGADYDNEASFTLQVDKLSGNHVHAFRNTVGLCSNSITYGNNYRLGVIFDGTNCSVYINGALGAAGAAASPGTFTSPGRFCIGGLNNPSTAAICEIVITGTALDVDQRADLDAYFCTKWGLS